MNPEMQGNTCWASGYFIVARRPGKNPAGFHSLMIPLGKARKRWELRFVDVALRK